MGDLIIGVDLGTSAVKAILVDLEGRVVGQGIRPVPFSYPSPGRVEIDPTKYYQQVCEVLGELAGQSGDASRIRGLSICAASGNTVLLDDAYKPITPVISWLDSRTKDGFTNLWPGLDPDRIYETVGWPLLDTFPLAHLAWLRDFGDGVYQRAAHHTMNNDALYHRLCGRLVTDPSKATTFCLQDQKRMAWNPDLLDFLELSPASLSEILPSGADCGSLTAEASAETGLHPGTRVFTGTFDHPSAARATGVFDWGDLLLSCGTSWVAFLPIPERRFGLDRRMLIDPFLTPGGLWGGMFALTAIASNIDRLIDRLLPIDGKTNRYRQFDDMAMSSSPAGNIPLIDPFKPLIPSETESIMAIYGPAEISRGIMEGCAFLMKGRLDTLCGGTAPVGKVVLTGGPTRSPVWPQILADVLNIPLIVPQNGPHAGAMGAAAIAAVGLDLHPDIRSAQSAMAGQETRVEPNERYRNVYRLRFEEFSA